MDRLNRRQCLITCATLMGSFSPKMSKSETGLKNWFELPEGGTDSVRTIQPAPERLVVDGKIRAGLFETPPKNANLLDAEMFRGPRAAWRRKRLMEWFGYGIITENWYLGMIIIDAKLVPISTVYVVDRRNGESFSHNLAAGRVSVAGGPWDDRTWAKGPGYYLEFTHNLERGKNGIRFDLRALGKPHMKGELELTEDMERLPSLSAVIPTQPPHFFYTHKACMPVGGTVDIGDEKVTLDPSRDLANLDEHRNYAQAPALWAWGTGAVQRGEGGLIAFNLGDTGGVDQDHWNENCLWIGNRMELLGPVEWSHNPKNPHEQWNVREVNGRVNMTFTPQNGKIVKLPPLGSYYQMAGAYNGFIIDEGGTRHQIVDVYGCAENGAIG